MQPPNQQAALADASFVVIMVFRGDFAVHAPMLLVLALRILLLVLRTLMLLASGATLCPLSLVVSHHLRVGLRVCHSSLHVAIPPRFSPRCCKEFNVKARVDYVF
jgi:hypothetical protein